jgi:hypothetical protein
LPTNSRRADLWEQRFCREITGDTQFDELCQLYALACRKRAVELYRKDERSIGYVNLHEDILEKCTKKQERGKTGL